jgi:phosphoglycerate dehydrogenase-like enzyme
MTNITLLVLANPKAQYLKALGQISGPVRTIISDQLNALLENCPEADVVLDAGTTDLLTAIFPRTTRLRWLHCLKAGVEPILSPELVTSDVVLTCARGVHKVPLAEFVMASVLFFSKDVARLIRNQQSGEWQQFDSEVVRGKVMGIVGYGETGRACAELARAFGMRVLGLRRHPELSRSDSLADQIFGPDRLLDMLASCDYVVLSAPSTVETRRLIGEAEINSMKSNAILINVGRGTLVDEAALICALEKGQIRGAALDVFEIEPLPSGHPFYHMQNILLSPHSTDHTSGWRERAVQFFLDNLERFIKGQPLNNIVDKKAGY